MRPDDQRAEITLYMIDNIIIMKYFSFKKIEIFG
jgi:hypothetical protein